MGQNYIKYFFRGVKELVVIVSCCSVGYYVQAEAEAKIQTFDESRIQPGVKTQLAAQSESGPAVRKRIQHAIKSRLQPAPSMSRRQPPAKGRMGPPHLEYIFFSLSSPFSHWG